MKTLSASIMVLLLMFFLAACGGGDEGETTATAGDPASELSAEQLENGIGPITAVTLGPIQQELADKGEEIFISKCALCHKESDKYVGPALGKVLDSRTPEYIMNMILNPDEMIKKHPEAKALLAQFMTQMPNQNMTEDDARAVLEYFRVLQTHPAAEPAE